MADPVVLRSVTASTAVAIGGLTLAFLGAERQRRHQERLAQQERAWQATSDGLLNLVATCRAMVDAIDRPGSIDAMEALDRERGEYLASVDEHVGVSVIGIRVGDVVHRMQQLVPAVEVYGSPACREAFHELRKLLRDSGYDPRAGERLAAVQRSKMAAVDGEDFRGAATARRMERQVLEDARTKLELDLDQTRALAERLIDTVRDSLAVHAR
ncbi:MAG: hypothetical protein ACXVW8_06460 [Nocardioidaceae bacterium]